VFVYFIFNRAAIIINKVELSTGVIDIGRKSACCLGAAIFGIGRILACFHCCGTVGGATGRLKSITITRYISQIIRDIAIVIMKC